MSNQSVVWNCGSCASSNFKIKDNKLLCALCDFDQSPAWRLINNTDRPPLQCKCGSPILSILYPDVLFCPNCKTKQKDRYSVVLSSEAAPSADASKIDIQPRLNSDKQD